MKQIDAELVRSVDPPGAYAMYKELPYGIASPVKFFIIAEKNGKASGELEICRNIVSITSSSGDLFFRNMADYGSSWAMYDKCSC